MPDVMIRLGREMLVFDGAMGTMLQRMGMSAGESPELLNVTAPEMVGQVLNLYRLAGSHCTITNTFGGSRPKLAEFGLGDRVEELNRAGVRAAKQYGAPHVLADMGPTGMVMQPLGTATFDEVFAAFAEQAAALAAESPDAIFIETMTDIAEARCALLAAKSVTDLPVFVSCTFGMAGVMDLSGTSPEAAAVILEAAGADAVGLNCGLGPDQMLPLLRKMVGATTLPVIAQPNAGLPRLEDGVTLFPGTPDEMGAFAENARAAGVAAVGSCCGSSPAFTGAIFDAIGDRDVVSVEGRGYGAATVLAGPRRVVALGSGQPMRVIGERINPTGKPKLREALLAGSMSVVRSYAAEQEAAGADLLDVNVGAAGVDASVVLPQAVLALVGGSDLPLVLDTTDAVALENALRIYPGKALVNSVNGEAASMESVLPLAARYGAAVVALALDDAGIPKTARGRLEVVARIAEAALAHGIPRTDIVVDPLVMTAAADAEAPMVTLDALRGATQQGFASTAGLSNVSHGLPMRPLLNAAFLEAAAAAGLDSAIANPNDGVVMESVKVVNQARATGEPGDTQDEAQAAWESAYGIALAAASAGVGAVVEGGVETGGELTADPRSALGVAVLRGDSDAAPLLVDAVLESGMPAENVIGEILTPAIQQLGEAYGRGEVFLPQLMVAAEAMKAAVTRVKQHLPEGGGTGAGRVAFATVKGDIHSIGKDICISLLESQGIDVWDLGVDVEAERVAAAASEVGAVCLSALMTTTLPAMAQTVERVRELGVPVFVGGAVVTEEWADSVGAGYSSDAPGCVRVVSEALAAAARGVSE